MSTERAVVLEQPLSVSECAELAGVSRDTILRRIRGGHLKAFRPAGSGDYIVHPQDFHDWLYGTPVQPRRREPAADARRAQHGPAERGSVEALSAIERGAA